MRKILSLGSDEFLRGIAISPDYENAGLFQLAEGIDLYRNLGTLRAGFDKTDLDSEAATVTDQILFFNVDTTNSKTWGWGDSNRFYTINNSDSPSFVASATVVRDMAIYKGNLIYARDLAVGKCADLATPEQADFDIDGIAAGGVSASSYHPLMEGPDTKMYVGNTDKVGSFTLLDGPPSSDWNSAALNLQSDYVVTSLENDGYYLIVGATKTFTAYRTIQSKVFFWDCFSPTFNREWTIPDSNLLGLKKIGDWIYAFAYDGIWRFTRDNPPEMVIHLGTGIRRMGTSSINSPHHIDVWKNILLFGGINVWSYGSIDKKRLSPIITQPFMIASGVGTTTIVYALKVINYNKIYVSSFDHKLYAFKTGNSAATAQTATIDLKRPYKIEGIKIVSKPLVSGDSLAVTVMDTNETTLLSGTYAYKTGKTTTSGFLNTKGTGDNIVDAVEIKLVFTGAVQVKRIDLFGTPWTEKYARGR